MASSIGVVDAIRAAEACIDRLEVEWAVVILEQVIDDARDHDDHEMALRVAALLERCGAPELAADVLARAARACPDDARAAEIAREARRRSAHPISALETTWRAMRRRVVLRDELDDVALRLVDEQIAAGRIDDAVEVLEELAARDPSDASIAERKASLLRLPRDDVSCS